MIDCTLHGTAEWLQMNSHPTGNGRHVIAFLVSLLFIATSLSVKAGQSASTDGSLPPNLPGKSWKLVWSDEFDGTELRTARWRIDRDAPRRDGWWTKRAIGLDGRGHLVIQTLKESNRYISGCVETSGKFEHKYGYYVARIQLQGQEGHWSAFWLMCRGVTSVGNGGRDGTEIDIMEKPWLDNRVQHTLHWDGYRKDHCSTGNVARVEGIMKGFHTFSLLWTPEEYVFYVDSRETWRTRGGGVSQVPQYILLSDEIGSWGGNITNAVLPDKMLIDYVRVYDMIDSGKPTR